MTTPTTDAPEGGQQDPTPEQPAEDAKTFTQADLDAKINERLARERKKFADYDALRAKAAQMDSLVEASQTEQEKAVAAAVAEAQKTTAQKYANRLVTESVRALVAGRNVDVEALLEHRDLSPYINDDGEVDREALTAWVNRISPPSASTAPDLGQGARGVTAAGADMNQILRQAAGRA